MNILRRLARCLPQSFFWRTFYLVFAAVLFSKVMTIIYLLLNDDILVDKQYSYGAAAIIRAYWAADDDGRKIIAQAASLEEHQVAPLKSEERWPYTQIFQRQIKAELGANSETRFSINPQTANTVFLDRSLNPSLWVYVPDLSPNWLEMKLYPRVLNSNKLFGLIIWMSAILLLAALMAYVLVSQINAPIAKLVKATELVGKGKYTTLALDNVPNEILSVYLSFNKMVEDVTAANAERAVMLAGISHDLRTPLTRLRLSLEMLEHPNKEVIKDMINDVNDSDKIIGQFIEFVQHSRANNTFTKCNIYHLLQEIEATFNRLGNAVNLSVTNPLPVLMLNEISIKRMFYNLVNNSFNHGANHVQINAFGTDKNIVMEIIDNGPGINPAQLEQVFTPFMRGNLARSKLGSGLGLAVVQRICEQHKGTIDLQNITPHGLKVTVTLPLNLQKSA